MLKISSSSKLLCSSCHAKESLTNAIIKDVLWISVNKELTTIFKLDRLPRSTHRDTG